jgi:hypothetical protein
MISFGRFLTWRIFQIDTRVALCMKPKRIHPDISNELWRKLRLRDGYIYNTTTKTLHVFLYGCHTIMRPVVLSFHTAGNTIFNEDEEQFTLEVVYPDGQFHSNIINDTFVVQRKLLLKE